MRTGIEKIKLSKGNLAYNKISISDSGDGNLLLVFLHDGLGSISQWKNFPNNLCNELKYNGLLFDRYNYGASDVINYIWKKDYMEDEAFIYLPELIEKLGQDKDIILIGHSDGATISLLFASTCYEKLKSIVSISPHIFVENITISGIKNLKKGSSVNLNRRLHKYQKEKTENLFRAWSEVWLSDDFRKWNIENYIRKIKCPVLAIQGNNDEFGTGKQIDGLKTNLNCLNSTVMIDGCGHFPHLENEKYTIEIIKNFISLINNTNQ